MSRHAVALSLLFVVILARPLLADSDRLVLDPSADADPAITLKSSSDQGCTVVFDLPYLDQETVIGDGQEFRSLTISGGGLVGDVGHPEIPTFSGLLALPVGRGVQADIRSREDHTLAGTRLAPVQPQDGGAFVVAPDYASSAADMRGPEVILGQPAIMHGRRVVPFVIMPMSCDPAAGTVTVASRLEIEFIFEGNDDRNNPRSNPGALPASFAGLFADRVVNHQPAADARSDELGTLGTYLIICPDNGNVVSALEPLLDWRRRQGYTVRLATTAEAGSSTGAIKSFIQGVYNTATVPLEFVVLVGDHNGDVAIPTFFESTSGYGGEGDHYYTELEGSDVLPDVFLGRLSCRTVSSLSTIVDKIVGYETAPPTTDPGWFTRASLTGDPSQSGITTIFVSQWLKAQLEATGFSDIDTFWSGNYASQMMTSLNQGLSVFTYRGFLGMSGFGSGHINASTNGGELPFAIFPTCDSGSWASTTDARNEAFLRRAGGGGIGAIGLATIGTHTRYNNCLFHGICETVVNGQDHRLGVAQAGGKLEMFANYQMFEPAKVEIWSVWSSLIGDPATDVWLQYPTTLDVDHPDVLPVGVGSVPITVTTGGSPLAGARVTVYKDGEISVSGVTDSAGRITCVLPDHSSGSLLVTVWGHGLMPYRGALSLGEVDQYVDLVDSQLDGDRVANPAETLQLSCRVQNRGTELAGAVSATLVSNDPFVTVTDAGDTFGDLDGGAAAWGDGGFTIVVDAAAPAGHELALTLTAVSGASSWESALRLPVTTSDLSVSGTAWSAGSTIDPGESGSLSLTLRNTGDLAAQSTTAVLVTSSPWITIADDTGVFGAIGVDGSGSNIADPFVLEVSTDCFQGHLAVFAVTLTQPGGAIQVVEFTLPVGALSSDDPVGPDAHGYYAFDNTDTGYLLAPTYAWVEIDPNHGGSGTSVGLSDFGYEQDDTKTIDLPFTFQYYGRSFDQISICSNGWVAMGTTTLKHWRNWSIPSAGSPDAMIAPFWDDLRQLGDNQVYAWHDEVNHRFVIQWSRMQNRHNGTQNFEIILNDPFAHPTSTGDGEIVFQYEAVTNNDNTRGYATAGIQNLDGTGGLLYTYYNGYAPGAAHLASGRAILFTPAGPQANVTCDVTPASITVTQAAGEQRVENLRVENNGDPLSVMAYSIIKVDPDAPTAAPDGDKNLTGSTQTVDTDEYPPGATVDMVFTTTCVSYDDEWIVRVEMDFPSSVTVNSATSIVGQQSFNYVGGHGVGALAEWEGGPLMNGQSGSATMNLSFADGVGTVEIPFILYGDQYGGPPHSVEGVIALTPSGPSVTVISPDGGELWAEGEAREIAFSVGGGPTAVDIELDRGDGLGWQTLATNVSASAGSFPWTVTGPVSAHCRVRLTDAADPAVQDVSDDEFTIGRDLSWLTVGEYVGAVVAGSGEDIDLTLDSSGLAEGTYRVDLVLSNTAGSPITVPITLVVSDITDVDAMPVPFELSGNHPNPFNPRTTIEFALPARAPVLLQIFDMRGRLVRTLRHGDMPAGRHAVIWDGVDGRGRPVASGVLVYRLESDGRVLSRKMSLMK